MDVKNKTKNVYNLTPVQIDIDLHTKIKTSASSEKMSINEFVGKLYSVYIKQAAHHAHQ
jgi:predicted HicB family RNase H-like nuclease